MLKLMGAVFVGLVCLNIAIMIGRSVHLKPVKAADTARLQQLEFQVESQQEMIDYHQELLEQRQQQPVCETEESEGFVKSVTPF